MDDKQFYHNGITTERFTKHDECFSKEHQVKVLTDDLLHPKWELAHLALYCLTYDENTPWGKLMHKACRLYRDKQYLAFEDHLEQMRAAINAETV